MTDDAWAQFTPQDAAPPQVPQGGDDQWSNLVAPGQEQAQGAPFSDRFKGGAKEALLGVAQKLAHTYRALGLEDHIKEVFGPNANNADTVDKLVNDHLDAMEKMKPQGVDWARMAGNAAGMTPLAAVLPAAAETYGGAAALGAGTSAVMGALQPIKNAGPDFWKQTAKDAGISAVGGALLGPAQKFIGGVINPEVDENVKTLMDKGVTPTVGQIAGGPWNWLESKLQSFPVLGDMITSAKNRSIGQLNEAAANEALAPISETLEGSTGRDMIDEVQTKLGKAYSDLLPKVNWKADPQFASDLGNLTNLAAQMPKDQADRFSQIVTDKVMTRLGPQGTMDGQTFKGLESEIGNLATGYMKDSSFDQRQLGSALRELQSTIRQGLARSNPDQAEELSGINRGWAYFTRLRDAAASAGDKSENAFTPSQLAAAVKRGDRSVGKGAYAAGGALGQDLSDAAVSVLGPKIPDSGTAGRNAAVAGLTGLALEGHKILPYMAENPIKSALIAGGGAAMAAPYTGLGQRLAAAAMTKRPNFAPQLEAAFNKTAAPENAALVKALLQSREQPGNQ